jgi:formate dehydrogenase subunit gamma
MQQNTAYYSRYPSEETWAMEPQTSLIEPVIQTIVARHKATAGALLPLLHDLQDTLGYIPAAATPAIAAALNLSRAEVHGVITYYHHFRETPPTRHTLEVCQAEACQARGCRSVTEKAKSLLGCDLDQTSADANWYLESTHCLGLCASGPSIQIDGRPHARITPERLEALVKAKDCS